MATASTSTYLLCCRLSKKNFLDPLKQELSKNRSSILDEMAVLKAELDFDVLLLNHGES